MSTAWYNITRLDPPVHPPASTSITHTHCSISISIYLSISTSNVALSSQKAALQHIKFSRQYYIAVPARYLCWECWTVFLYIAQWHFNRIKIYARWWYALKRTFEGFFFRFCWTLPLMMDCRGHRTGDLGQQPGPPPLDYRLRRGPRQRLEAGGHWPLAVDRCPLNVVRWHIFCIPKC